jgi:organic radical activating enzyme
LEQAIQIEAGTVLPVMEAFYTLQGEGVHQGRAAYFIRLGGCDVGCHWCDVKESWDAEAHPQISVKDIVRGALEYPCRLAVITGGEPLIHNLQPLTSALKKAGFEINIETSGSSPISGQFDWVCLSPKKFKQPLAEAYRAAGELKVIIFNKSDFQWGIDQASKVNPDCRLLLQPEWSRMDLMMPLIIDFIKANPQWRVSLQTHKFMQIP